MKNLFSKVESPLEQMANSLDMYSDPTASFIAEGPKFYFGNETGTSPDHDTDASLGREWDGNHSRKLNTDYERRLRLNKHFDGETDDEFFTRMAKEAQEKNSDLVDDERSELDRQADELLAGEGEFRPSTDALDNVEDIGDFDVSDYGDEVIITPTDDELAAKREAEWNFDDPDDPDAVLGAPEEPVLGEEPVEALAATTAEELSDIASKLTHFPDDLSTPEDVKEVLTNIQKQLADLKSRLGEGTEEMFSKAMELLNEEAGKVVPTSGEVNGVSVLSKYQDPATGEVFVKAVDGRVFCVTVGMNGSIAEVKRTSFNPAFPDAYVRADKAAIDALGVSFTPKL